MRTVLIGTDFMYDKNGNLKPIEINTAVGWDGIEKVEDNTDCINLDTFSTFVESNGFTTIVYIGDIPYVKQKLEEYCNTNEITFTFMTVSNQSITVPAVEDDETTLIIRSSYDTTAIVDDNYCRNKLEFMKLIKNQSYGSQFVYKDEENTIVSNITEINDNGVHPNFVLKSILPNYDKEIYPKFFKVSNQQELDLIIQENVTSDNFLMECHINTDKLWNGHSVVIRSLNILFPPNLESIQIGQYTKLNQNILLENVTYDNTTYVVNEDFRESYLTNAVRAWEPKLLDGDMVEMADGTFKTALELEIGDIIKTIDLPPTENGTSNSAYMTAENLGDFNTISTGTTYSTNRVINKKRVNRLSAVKEVIFSDNTNWEDTVGSLYLIERENRIYFERIGNLIVGDVVLLLNNENENVEYIRKIVSNVQEVRKIFSGWFITVENAHLFLTKQSYDSNNNFVSYQYVSIEHNYVSCPIYACSGCSQCVSCPKAGVYCWTSGPQAGTCQSYAQC